MKSDTFCVLPHASLSIDGPGRPRLCCNNTGHYMLADGLYVGDLDGTADAINTDLHREVRLSMSRGERHPSCAKCWRMEDSGSKSFRQIWNGILGTDVPDPLVDGSMPQGSPIRYMDITLGNKCNLVCRMCNWANSHLWHVDNAKLGRFEDIDDRLKNQFWFENDDSIDLLIGSLDAVTHLNFLGGEPLIVPQHMRILRACVDSGRSGQIELSYNTNLTRLPQGILDIWPMFKRVYVNVSLEGTGAVNDYIRQNSEWHDIVSNMDLVGQAMASHGNIRMDVHATLGIYNALTLHELVSFCRRSHHLGGRLPFINLVYRPEYQDIRNLPDTAKTEVAARLMSAIEDAVNDTNRDLYIGAINHMMADAPAARPMPGWPDDQWLRFWHDADAIDALKSRSMRHYLPELDALRPR